MKKQTNCKKEAIFQIAVLIIATIAFSYLMHENASLLVEKEEIKINPLLILLKIAGKIIFGEKGLVSAEESPFLTCVKTKSGESCKGYYNAEECRAQCEGACVPNPPSQISECKLGTCYDEAEGTCAPNSPLSLCSENEGTFIDDPNGNVLQCRKGCCLLGDNSRFITDKSCAVASERLGIEKNFKPEIRTEMACLASAQSHEEGACITGTRDSLTGKANCVFTRKDACLKARGEFHSGFLCSYPELNTNCEKQKVTSCVAGKEEIYWFDSKGNRENIYEGSSEFAKIQSWNEGKIKMKSDSCSVAVGKNYLANQGTCGNCNHFLSSRCGEETLTEKLSDPVQKAVCRDLSCTDESGKTRLNGETWCVYQGAIGVDGNRATDTPGSRHFKSTCIDGEVATESCGEYRQGVCVEAKTTFESGKVLSSADCVKNLGDLCVTYNSMEEGDKIKECNENPFCFVKKVDVDKDFRFNICAPKFPVGHNLATGEGSSACALASQKCTAVKKKTLQGGWDWVSNEDCTKAEFAQKMNDLCMSLGDCGAEVNYEGDLTKNYKVSRAASLTDVYLNGIKKYSDVVPGKFAESPDVGEYYGSIGIPNGLGSAEDVKDSNARFESMQLMTGMGGLSLGWAVLAGKIGTLGSAVIVEGATAPSAITASGGAATAGVVAGAVVGAALTSWLISETGIGAGLTPAMVYTLMTFGAAGGAVMGYALVQGGGWAGFAAAGGPVGLVILVVVVVVVLLMAWGGIGKIKKIKVSFRCYPWEPPKGGKNCENCGDDGLPCSPYACSSLGATCRFINEGTSDEKCIDVAPNDISAPVISPWPEKLQSGFSFQNPSELGVNIKSNEEDGCIRGYSILEFGLLLDKYGKCRYSTLPNIPYEEMLLSETEDGENIGDDLTPVAQKNITYRLRVPSLEMLGYSSYDTNRRIDYNMYIKCENSNLDPATGGGYSSDRDYNLNFCIKPGEDLTAPSIDKVNPSIEYVKSGAAEQFIGVWTNEPADCKWDIANKDYDLMKNNFTCANDFEEQELFGWKCEGGLPITQETNNYYVRCMDKPWENETSKRNKNAESTTIVLRKTTPLVMDSATPDNETISSGVEPASVDVEVRTSGGVDGSALCSYSFDGEHYISFLDTLGIIHSQAFESFIAGDKFINLKCEDAAGNIAWRNISFSVVIDREEPKISRIFYDGSNLVVKTTERADCAMSPTSCTFDFVNGTIMTGSDTDHRASPDTNKVYYIKCKDQFNNVKGDCDATVKVVAGVSQQL